MKMSEENEMVDSVSDEEFEKLVKELMDEDSDLFKALANDTSSMEAIVIRDGCAFCKEKVYPCECTKGE